MTEGKPADQALGVTVLSLLLAGLLWLAVTLEHNGEARFQVPIVLDRVPSGMQVAGAAPMSVEVTVSGPRILLLIPWLHGALCRLDLSGAQAGSNEFRTAEASFGLDPEIKVVRVQPAALRLELAPAGRGGQ